MWSNDRLSHRNSILPGSTIGILGGGQLGRMVALEAKRMGYRVVTLDPTPDCPCAQVADAQVVAEYTDVEAALRFAEQCDVVLYEFEDVDAEVVAAIESKVLVPQGSAVLFTTRHRMREKNALSRAGIPVAPHRAVHTFEDLERACEELGRPLILKTTTGGYDGKGQWRIGQEDDIETIWAQAQSLRPSQPGSLVNPLRPAQQSVGPDSSDDAAFVAETEIAFQCEVSVVVARTVTGEVKTFPVVENIHVHHILHQSICPARVDERTGQAALEIAVRTAESLGVVGLLAIEMFVLPDGRVFVNELAPRPHNSGHFTQDACVTSQFDQLIRCVCGLPLGDTALLSPVVMVNILGAHLDGALDTFASWPSNMKLHLYGKAESRARRKMGHINVIAPSVEEALSEITALNIWSV